MDKADWITALLCAYQKFGGNLEQIFSHYTSTEVIREITDLRPENISYKLWRSDNTYTQIFKMGIYGYILAEIGIIPPKYKKTINKVLMGSGIAAMTLPGSGPARNSSGNFGSSGNSETWRYSA